MSSLVRFLRLALLSFSCLGFGGIARAQEGPHWDLNDVSVLLPLPETASDLLTMLDPPAQGASGALLPARYLNHLPALVAGGGEGEGQVMSQLRVVAIRLDPCFPGGATSGSDCRAQIRLVWQPITLAGGRYETVDAAVHSFYELSGAEFAVLAQKLASLNGAGVASPTGLSLRVNPRVAAHGLSGGYWGSLRSLILAYTGDARLSRITFMDRVVTDRMWDFGGFDIAGQNQLRLPIPRTQAFLQSFMNADAAPTPSAFRGSLKPGPDAPADQFGAILSRVPDITAQDVSLLQTTAQSAHRIENPNVHSSETVDCVSCHLAQPIRAWAEARFPGLGLGQSAFKFTASPELNLRNESAVPPSSHVLRAFGYVGRDVSISQRAIHETAAVADWLNAR